MEEHKVEIIFQDEGILNYFLNYMDKNSENNLSRNNELDLRYKNLDFSIDYEKKQINVLNLNELEK